MPSELNDDGFWRDLLAQNDRWLRTSLYARLRDADAVDEVMQDVALAVLQNRSQLRDISKAGPWMHRIAIRQALLYRRRCGRRRALNERYRDRQSGDMFEKDATAWLLSVERNAMVRQAVRDLPARDAEMLMLKYSEGWSYQQIAERLGVSTSAVESRLHRARKQLRGRLSAMGAVETARS